MKRWILIIIIFVIAIGTYSVVFRSKGILDQITLSNQLETLKLEIDSLKRELKSNRERVKKTKNDSLYMETIVRTKLGMSRKGEKVFRFISQEKKPANIQSK
jgi:cell division protein FtsB